MDTLIKTKNTITELNDRFFLILENFVPNYIKYLQDPTNTQLADEVLHVDTVNNRIQSDGFILKNSMESAIQTSQQEMATLNVKIETLKKENDKLTEQVKKLEKTSLTSVGLYDEEIDWYRLQVKTVLILLIGFIAFFESGLEISVPGWSSTFILEELSVKSDKAVFYLSFYWLGMLVARLIFANLMKKISLAKIFRFCIISAIVGSLFMILFK